MAPPAKKARHSLADLPVAWVTQVLDYCSVRVVFVCMRVSRSWATAARAALVERRSLVLVDMKHDDLSCPLDVLCITEESDAKAVVKSLHLLSRLKHLQVWSCGQDSLILWNHETLVSLIATGDMSLNFGETVFPNLKRLQCLSLTSDCVPCFPSLRHLKLTGQLPL